MKPAVDLKKAPEVDDVFDRDDKAVDDDVVDADCFVDDPTKNSPKSTPASISFQHATDPLLVEKKDANDDTTETESEATVPLFFADDNNTDDGASLDNKPNAKLATKSEDKNKNKSTHMLESSDSGADSATMMNNIRVSHILFYFSISHHYVPVPHFHQSMDLYDFCPHPVPHPYHSPFYSLLVPTTAIGAAFTTTASQPCCSDISSLTSVFDNQSLSCFNDLQINGRLSTVSLLF